jgi:magnesium-protoporphyrin O-methyltransferase
VGRIRATVRAGRDRMRGTLLDWLPANLNGARVLDAGCGTGALAVELARRGAQVLAIDLSPTLVQLARERLPVDLGPGAIDFRSGDMLDPALGGFDHVVAMDSLIHYDLREILGGAVGVRLGSGRAWPSPWHRARPRWQRCTRSASCSAPRSCTPAIMPVAESVRQGSRRRRCLPGGEVAGTTRIERGFYRSQAFVLQNLGKFAQRFFASDISEAGDGWTGVVGRWRSCWRRRVGSSCGDASRCHAIDVEATHDTFHAREPRRCRVDPEGDSVLVHGAPSRVPFGTQQQYITRDGRARQLAAPTVRQAHGRDGTVQELYDVGFEG